MSDQNHGNGSTSEEVDVLELEPTPEEANALGGDPLDDITDPAVRAEAKKNRAIARRVARKGKDGEVVTPPVETPDASKFVTKADFEGANERKAIIAVQAQGLTNDKGEVILPPEEVKANFAEIQKLYVPRRGRQTTEDIAEDIKDAVILFNARNPKAPDADNGVGDLTATPVVAPSGGTGDGKKPPAEAAKLPGYNPATQPKDWYPKKKQEGES